MNETLKTFPQKEESVPKIEKKGKMRKIFQVIRLVFIGATLIMTKGDSTNPQKAALDLFTSENPNTLPIDHDESQNEEVPAKNDLADYPSEVPQIIEQQTIEDKMVDEEAQRNIIDQSVPDPQETEITAETIVEPVKTETSELELQADNTTILGTGEYVQYIIDNYSQESIGLSFDGHANSLLSPNQTNEIIAKAFTNDQFMRSVVILFHPEMSEDEITNYLKNYKILIGNTIDHYLTDVRSGSWGTTVATITTDGQLKFETISLKSDFTSQDYEDDEWGSVTRLVREEFFQAHQYNVFAQLFNSGYLADVADIKTVDDMIEAISDENLRAFLELFPQQKILTDSGAGGNAYNFYIGDTLQEGNPTAKINVDASYNTLADFIENKLGVSSTPEAFLNPDFIIEVNNTFREKYLGYYLDLGFNKDDVNIWNLVGMKRGNSNSINSLDMPAILPLPIE